MENIGLVLADLFLGLIFIQFARYSGRVALPIPLLKNNISWLYFSIAFVCLLTTLKFAFYNTPEEPMYSIVQQCILLSFSFIIYFLLAIIFTLRFHTKPRKVRALLLIPISFYALLTFQWQTFTYSNIILFLCLMPLLGLMVKKYNLTQNMQLLMGMVGVLGLSLLTLFQNHLENITNPVFYILYTPIALFCSFILYRGVALFLFKSNPSNLNFIIKRNPLNFSVSTGMYQNLLPKTIEEVQSILKKAKHLNKSISCQSTGYSIGGQSSLEEGVLLEVKKMAGIEFFDPVNGIIKVGPATTWQQLRQFLSNSQKNHHDAWVLNIMPTHFLDYSIAGAVSANIHGNELLGSPLIHSIKSLDLLDASGKTHQINRTLSPELFSLVIGGYGLFGVITGVELNLSKKRIVQRKVSILSVHDFPRTIDHNVKSGSIYFEYYLNTNIKDSHFLKNGTLSTYKYTDIDPKKTPLERSTRTLKENLPLCLNNITRKIILTHRAILNKNNRYYWSGDIVPYFSLEKNIKTINLFFPEYEDYRLIQHEYYIPIPILTMFIKHLRQHIICKEFNLTEARVTLIKKHIESFLHYSNQDYAAIALCFSIPNTIRSLAIINEYLIDITENVILHHGSFSLDYIKAYNKKHLLKAYPQLNDFLKLKQKYDPDELFQSNWYHDIKNMCHSTPSDTEKNIMHSVHFHNPYH